MEETFSSEKEKRQADYEDFKLVQESNYQFRIVEMVREKMQRYERVEHMFSKFFDIQELEATFDRKADIELIHELNNSKATKVDV